MESHYSPAIARQLQTLADQGQWQGFPSYLSTLSNAQFRTAGYIIGERLVPSLTASDAWELIAILTDYNARAFLVTLLKPIAQRLIQGSLSLSDEGCHTLMKRLAQNSIDASKTLQQLLPVLRQPSEVQQLFTLLSVEEGGVRVRHLLNVATMPASYCLFQTLRYADHDRPFLLRVTRFLVRRGDGLAFNLASLLRTYYGLDEVQGTFSLNIEPYQLARLATSYEAFCQAMRH